jgi:hypothetical protein
VAQADQNGADRPTTRPACGRSTEGHQQQPSETKADGGDGELRNPHARVPEGERRMLPFQDRIERESDSNRGDPIDQTNLGRRDDQQPVTGDSGQDVLGGEERRDQRIADDEGRGRNEKQRSHEDGGSSGRVR